jgi:Mg-chelatase subunit ChlD
MSGQRLDDAKHAATTFIELLDMQQNQAALVTFAHDAQLDAPLTHDGAALAAAINALTSSNGSNIAKGIQVALDELIGERHNPQAAPVLILLSDGRANDEDAVRAVAQDAKAHGIQLIAIGFGNKANRALLEEIVSSSSDLHLAPTSAELAGIYASIAQVIDQCPETAATPAPTSTPLPNPAPAQIAETPSQISSNPEMPPLDESHSSVVP